jgi:hypothetical protein
MLCPPCQWPAELRFGSFDPILASAEQILAPASWDQELESKIQRV